MSYTSADQSVQDGAPIEVYAFVGTGASYYYNDSDSTVTVAGQEYLPLNISRNTIDVSSVTDSIQTVDIEVPVDSDLAQAFALRQTRDSLDVTIRRVHRGTDFATESELVWKGFTLYFSTTGRRTTIQTGTLIQAALNRSMNTIYYQAPCNHVLYDARCALLKASFTTTSTVSEISGLRITVLATGVGNNALRAGELIVTRTGERRFVMGNALDYIDVGYEFNDIQVGDEVTMIQGCNHSFDECKTKFSNQENFGGFIYTPTKNPFEEGV